LTTKLIRNRNTTMGTTNTTKEVAMNYHIDLAANNRRVLSDGHTTIDCQTAFKIMGILKELAACNCEASINDGMLWLADGTSFDLDKLVKEASRG